MSATGGGRGSVPFPVFLPCLLINEKTHEGEEGEVESESEGQGEGEKRRENERMKVKEGGTIGRER